MTDFNRRMTAHNNELEWLYTSLMGVGVEIPIHEAIIFIWGAPVLTAFWSSARPVYCSAGVARGQLGYGANRLAHISYLAAKRAGGSRSRESRGSTDTSR